MTKTFRRILSLAGYEGEATEENVIDCFLDYVDTGAFEDLDYVSAKQDIEDGDITVEDICKAMLNILG